MLIDTHAHLYFEHFDADREEVIRRAREGNVARIINIGVDLPTSRRCIEMAEQHPGLFAAVGVHPNDSADFGDEAIAALKELAGHPRVVAIGEIGLDFYRDRSPAELQERAFRMQIRLAKEVGLPIVIHNRSAGWEILRVLESEGTDGLRGVFHCFSEDAELAERVLEMG
ncbi:MAG: TatD family deoxyribonuclease, partial [Calditrichaeota bacterium]